MKKNAASLSSHLTYEIDMLRATFNLLRSMPKSVIANAVMESFCIHARNLDEFFMERGKKNRKLRASDFAETYKRPKRDPTRDALIDKIHGQIAHLTYSRVSEPEKKIGPVDREAILTFLEADIANFDKCRDDKDHLLSHTEALVTPMQPALTSTTTSSSVSLTAWLSPISQADEQTTERE
jgi:hypothetical protein